MLTEYVITYEFIVVFKFLAYLNNYSENLSKGYVHVNLLKIKKHVHYCKEEEEEEEEEGYHTAEEGQEEEEGDKRKLLSKDYIGKSTLLKREGTLGGVWLGMVQENVPLPLATTGRRLPPPFLYV
jgi:hypothetical protein